LAVAPGYMRALHGFGTALLLEGEYERAVEQFRPVLAHRPDHLRARLDLAHCLLELGRFEAGVAELRTIVRAAPRCYGNALKMLASSRRVALAAPQCGGVVPAGHRCSSARRMSRPITETSMTEVASGMNITFRCPPELEPILPRPSLALLGLPDWFKALPASVFGRVLQQEVLTVKKCPPTSPRNAPTAF
jgi:tetratricopeptide (TPR) repeat protein